ncbi:outer membrane lipoprotein A [Neisseria shayeganii 871]|uniref:Outer membrane lipoprotein A n=2 Tax=Neisseria shayeganii TaxID=607712 RepID=G4CKM0_9NEIS|nr:outer membrane lipoprotein A [Neisseria shayeganii 871]
MDQVQYRGTMYYHYHDNQPQTADVLATYRGSDKTLAMKIDGSGDNGVRTWYLGGFGNTVRRGSSNLSVPVSDNGKVSGTLWLDNTGGRDARLKPDGHFDGGFYGTQGEVLTGKASNEGGEKWEGVIGATAAQAKP